MGSVLDAVFWGRTKVLRGVRMLVRGSREPAERPVG